MIYAYDIECLANLFTATFVNIEDENDRRVFYIGLGKEDYSDLNLFLSTDMTLVGYNNHSYDDPMLRFLSTYEGKNINHELFQLSSMLVDDNYRMDKKIIELRYPRKTHFSWKSIDLMKILAFDKLGISLKQTAINLKWHRIQDMPVDHFHAVSPAQLPVVLDYNLNDVLITRNLYHKIIPLIKFREELSSLYDADFSSASDSKIANIILEKTYTQEFKVNVQEIRDLRTERENVLLGACIAEFVSFQTPALAELLDRISATVVWKYNGYRYGEEITFGGKKYSLGIGGLHSEDSPGIFVSDEEYLIQDMDVASYYPNLIINNNFYPEHLGKSFITVLRKLTHERLEAKRTGNKIKADALKITINSIFGKMGSETFWLLDAKQMLSTTLTGQLCLLMLIEDLTINGIKVISCNTDGIVCKVRRDMLDVYFAITKAWQEKTGLELEFTPYKKYVRRDVNSYVTQKEDGSTKEKGAFLKEIDLKKSYHMPIVAKALYAYFIEGIPVRQTLENCKDIMEFCISQKTGDNFVMELVSGKDVQALQKTNRFYISKKGKTLVKRHTFTNKKVGLYVGNLVEMLNEYDPTVLFENYSVDLNFYENEVMKIIEEIEPKQLQLFDTEETDFGSISRMEYNPSHEVNHPEKNTAQELNKLGKNQIISRIKSIVTSRGKIEGISSRYIYIMTVDIKNKEVSLYCLGKGSYEQIRFKKEAYKKNPLREGMLVYCTKFEKDKNGYLLADYKIVENFEEEVPKLI